MSVRLHPLIGLLSWAVIGPQGWMETHAWSQHPSPPGGTEASVVPRPTDALPAWWFRNQGQEASCVLPQPNDDDGGFTVLGRPAVDRVEARRHAETAARDVLTRWLIAKGRPHLAAWDFPETTWRAILMDEVCQVIPNDPASLVYEEAPSLVQAGFRLDLSSGMLARLEQAHAEWRMQRRWIHTAGVAGFLLVGFLLHRLANRFDDLTRGYFSWPIRAVWLIGTLVCGAVIAYGLS